MWVGTNEGRSQGVYLRTNHREGTKQTNQVYSGLRVWLALPWWDTRAVAKAAEAAAAGLGVAGAAQEKAIAATTETAQEAAQETAQETAIAVVQEAAMTRYRQRVSAPFWH